MKKTLLKSAVGIITFAVGMFTVTNWIIYPLSLTPNFDVQIPNAIETEESETYAVYSAVLNELIIKNRERTDLLKISDSTALDGSFEDTEKTDSRERIERMKEIYPTVEEEILIDYDAKQLRPVKLRPKFNLSVEYILINAKKTKKGEGYAAAGMIKFSGIGFNRQRNQALVEIEYFCPLCGFGSYVLLEKEDEVWKIKKEFGGWVS